MAVNTLLLDFSVQPSDLKNEQDMSNATTKIENVLRDHLSNLKSVDQFSFDGGFFKLYTSDKGVITAVRVYNNGLITINIEYFKGDGEEGLFDYKVELLMFLCCVFLR